MFKEYPSQKNKINQHILWFFIMRIILVCLLLSWYSLLLVFFFFFCVCISDMGICWLCAEIQYQFCSFTSIFTVVSIVNNIVIILMEHSWSEKCGKIVWSVICITFWEKICDILRIWEAYSKCNIYTSKDSNISSDYTKIFSNTIVVLFHNVKNPNFLLRYHITMMVFRKGSWRAPHDL